MVDTVKEAKMRNAIDEIRSARERFNIATAMLEEHYKSEYAWSEEHKRLLGAKEDARECLYAAHDALEQALMEG
jgi:hypothetical protein